MDSEIAFRSRAEAIGVPKAYVDALCTKGVNKFSAFAFVSSYQPNAPDETPFIKPVQSYVGEDPAAHLPALRRLFWESHTLAVQDMRDRFEARPSQEPKKLSMPDRVDRLKRLKTALTGLTIDTVMEPSHDLVDRFVAQAEEQCFAPVALSLCTSRETEMRAEKKDPVAMNIEGMLKITKSSPGPSAEIGSELHVRSCMVRRALAMHMAGISAFTEVDRWVSKLFGFMLKPALNNNKPPSLQQIIEADKTVWMLVAQRTRGEVLTSGSPRPIDAALAAVQDSPEVAFCLLPRPGGGKGKKKRLGKDSSSDSGPDPRKPKKKKKKVKDDHKKPDDPKKPNTEREEPKKPRIDIPAGANMKGPDGKPNCFAYSRGNCKCQEKEKCGRGMHRCWFCHGTHPGKDCPSRKSE